MFKNIVKNTVAALVLAAPFVSFAAAPATSSKFSHFHKAGFAVQLANGSPDYAYYTKDHSFVMGVYSSSGLYTDGTQTNGTSVKRTFNPGFFVRKMYKIDDNLQWGVGTSNNLYLKDSGYDTAYRSDAFTSKPVYLALEYFVSPKTGFSCSYRPFVYDSVGTDANHNHVKSYGQSGSVQLIHIFG